MSVGHVSLRPASRHDWLLIRQWLLQPGVQRWWGDLNSAEAEIQVALGMPLAICRIIEAGGQPAGYAHCLDATTWGERLPDGMPAGTWDADLFIGASDQCGLGIGETALKLLCEEVFASTLAVAVSIFAPVTNEAAVRGYERAGFHWRTIWNDPIFGPCWMLLRERPR